MTDLPRIPTRAFALLTIALLTLLSAAAPLVAQRTSTQTTDPVAAARALFDQRVPAADAAKQLTETHRQTAEETLRLLTVVGYRAPDVAATAMAPLGMVPGTAARVLRDLGIPAKVVASSFVTQRVAPSEVMSALRSADFPAVEATAAAVDGMLMQPLAAYESLQGVGFSVGDLSKALVDLGLPVEMGCIGPNGYPAPCGNFGQGDNTPVMGQVTWAPQGSAEVGTVVTFESVNIPPLDVLLGGLELEVLEMGPSRVRARLPDAPATGALAFRRHSDDVVGVIEESYDVVAPDPLAGIDWPAASTAAFEGALADADAWIMGSRFDAAFCKVMAVSALGSPGVLRNPAGFGGGIESRLLDRGVPMELAQAWQGAFEGAFLAWADNVTIPGVPFYPAFAAFPGKEAPPVPNVPFPLAMMTSAGVGEMTQPLLYQRLRSALPASGSTQADAAIAAFAFELGTTFEVFLLASVNLVFGEGPVPAYDPPAVMAAPVVDGSCSSPGMWASILPSGVQVNLPGVGW